MKLTDLLKDAPPIEVTGIAVDSRKVRPGYVFAAVKGGARDGRAFIRDAVSAGASAILTDIRPGDTGSVDADTGAPIVRVADVRLALAQIAERFHPGQPATVAAVTGTNGKSSTVDFLRQIWSHEGRAAASIGTLGVVDAAGRVDTGHTTPDPVSLHETLEALAAKGVTHAAMEASSHGLDQRRLDAVKLSAGAFTNLTQDHLDYHPDFDAYRAAKLRLFADLLPAGSAAVINADSPEKSVFEAAAAARGLEILSVGWRGGDLRFVEVSPKATSQLLKIFWRGQETTVRLPLIGEFQALNALAAAGLALALGSDARSVFNALERLVGVRGRLELVGESPSGGAVFVDYAHTPDGLDTLLRAARPHAPGKVYCVFGCGGDRDPYKRPLMGQVAARLADVVIVTDDNPRSEDPASIRRSVLQGARGATEIADRTAAIGYALSQIQKGDALLIAGKGHETGQIVKDRVIPYSDHDAVAAALRGMGQGDER
ncbi:UDP-N-acetylmuramoyl-L-alanyl-D-glutamate--2,6-diaminopimelate ligase [bacterium]|nr:UDP-N-acetylmuramoyl-L-alanyl-D-glutamate--2,6-diaminopimelate ligase [bacterium]